MWMLDSRVCWEVDGFRGAGLDGKAKLPRFYEPKISLVIRVEILEIVRPCNFMLEVLS